MSDRPKLKPVEASRSVAYADRTAEALKRLGLATPKPVAPLKTAIEAGKAARRKTA